jgi:DNA (cytosine-5)-methyltransferase 1
LYSYKDILIDLNLIDKDSNVKSLKWDTSLFISKEMSALSHLMMRKSSIDGIPYGRWFYEELKNSKDVKFDKELLLNCIDNPNILQYNQPIPPLEDYSFTFADIFCNVGGATLGLMKAGGRCVFSYEEKLKPSRHSYGFNFGIIPYSNVDVLKEKEFPKVDVIITSLDIQSLPLNKGKKPKFDSMIETNWYTFIEFVNKLQPKAVIIESNKTQRHESFDVSTSVAFRTLKEATGYYATSPAILDALNYGVPQMRKRLWFVAFSNPLSTLNYEWPLPEKRTWKLKDILEEKVEPKYYLTKKHELYLEKNDKTNKDKGYWFSSIVLDPEKESKSISFGGQGWDRNIIYDEINAPESLPNNKEINSKKLRRLTTRELLRLQGFPEEFAIPSIWTISWSFMGMATNVNVAERIGKSVLKAIDEKTIEKSAKILINSGINF